MCVLQCVCVSLKKGLSLRDNHEKKDKAWRRLQGKSSWFFCIFNNSGINVAIGDLVVSQLLRAKLGLPHFDFQVTLNAVCWWCCLIQMPRSSWWCTEWKSRLWIFGVVSAKWFRRSTFPFPHSIFEVYWKYIRGKFQFDIHPRALPDLPAAEEVRNTFCTSFNDTQKTKDPWIRRLLFILYHFLRWSRKDSLSFALF